MIIELHVFEESLNSRIVSFGNGFIELLYREEKTNISEPNILRLIEGSSIMFDL